MKITKLPRNAKLPLLPVRPFPVMYAALDKRRHTIHYPKRSPEYVRPPLDAREYYLIRVYVGSPELESRSNEVPAFFAIEDHDGRIHNIRRRRKSCEQLAQQMNQRLIKLYAEIPTKMRKT